MNKDRTLTIYTASVDTHLALFFADQGIRAGFPSPAQDYMTESIDLNRELIRHPASTFLGRVNGDSMCEEFIDDGDILVIDKSLEIQNDDLAVCFIDGEFTLKRVRIEKDVIYLVPSNSDYPQIKVTAEDNFQVWGVVTYTIRKNRRRR